MDSPRHPAGAQGEARHSGSGSGDIHFVTLETPGHEPWLSIPRTRDVFLAVLRSWHEEKQGAILAAIAMPDHAQVLMQTGNAGAVEQTIALWKSAIRRGAGYAETFRSDNRVHLLRHGELEEEYALFAYLKPYRARLITPEERWPGWWLPNAGRYQFTQSLNPSGGPPQAWMEWPAQRFAGLEPKY